MINKNESFINGISLFATMKEKTLKIRQKCRHVLGFREMYRAKEKAKDPHKVKVNSLLASYTRTRKVGYALILDSEELVTTKALVRAGMKKEHIEIPNPFICHKINRKHKNSYDHLLSEHLEMVKETGQEAYSIAFFDFCCSLDGNSLVQPLEDINNYFKYYLPKHDSILAVTICKRNVNHNGNSDLNRLDSKITNSAYNYGYNALKEPVGYPYNNMYVVFYRILKEDET